MNQYHSLDKKRAIELEKQNANQKEMDFGEFLFYLDEFLKFSVDKKHSEARRAYEEWARRKQIEDKEKQRWGSMDEIDYTKKPFC